MRSSWKVKRILTLYWIYEPSTQHIPLRPSVLLCVRSLVVVLYVVFVCASAQADPITEVGGLGSGGFPLPNAPASAYGSKVRPGPGHPNLADMAGISARLRLQGHLAESLHLANRVLEYAPNNRQALQTQISSLSDLGAAYFAFELSEHKAAGLPARVRRRLRADRAAAAIRRALAKRKRLDRQKRYAKRDQPLKHALELVNRDLVLFPKTSHAYQRSRYDHIYALSQLGRAKAAVHAFRALGPKRHSAPAYVRHAAADALMALHKCAPAGRMYARLIANKKQPGTRLLKSRYYSLVNCEHYGHARQILQRLVNNTPVWRYVHGKKGKRKPNWQRLSVDRLRVLDAYFRHHPKTAQSRAFALYKAAPRNVSLINLAAKTLRWRDLPNHAHRVAQRAAAYAPKDSGLRLNEAKIAHARGHYTIWRQHVKRLASLFPHSDHIQIARAEVRDRRRPSASVTTHYGSSTGNTGRSGSKDFQITARGNSPWTKNGFRAIAVQDYQYANYGSYSARIWRPGLGLEWAWGRKQAKVLVSDGVDKSPVGVRLQWSQWVTDRWKYELTVDTAARKTPLRATRVGLTGQLYGAHLIWQQNESRSASLNLSELRISDGNLRSSVSAQFSQRLQASAHHITRLSLYAGFENNTVNNAPYYNPRRSGSIEATLHHSWITWRHYQQVFRQKFKASVGSDFESGYGASASYSVQYGQGWDLSRTWSLHYAVGYGSHVYNGNREGRVFGIFGVSGTF